MTTQDLALMQAAIKKMHWHEQRQRVLAQNIANADTAGYRALDLAPLDFKALLESSSRDIALSVATTDPQHFGSGGASGSSVRPVASGNAAVLEEQLLKMNENYVDHRLTTTIYQKNIDMLKRALRFQ